MDTEIVDRAGNVQAARRIADRGDMVGLYVHKGDVMAGAGQVCAYRAADRAGAPNKNVLVHFLLLTSGVRAPSRAGQE
ncbi:hypothetical protein D3C87_1737890 [compost metagenome]